MHTCEPLTTQCAKCSLCNVMHSQPRRCSIQGKSLHLVPACPIAAPHEPPESGLLCPRPLWGVPQLRSRANSCTCRFLRIQGCIPRPTPRGAKRARGRHSLPPAPAAGAPRAALLLDPTPSQRPSPAPRRRVQLRLLLPVHTGTQIARPHAPAQRLSTIASGLELSCMAHTCAPACIWLPEASGLAAEAAMHVRAELSPTAAQTILNRPPAPPFQRPAPCLTAPGVIFAFADTASAPPLCMCLCTCTRPRRRRTCACAAV